MASVVEFDLGLVQQITDHVDGVGAVPSCHILSFTLSKVSGASTSSVTVSDDFGDFAFQRPRCDLELPATSLGPPSLALRRPLLHFTDDIHEFLTLPPGSAVITETVLWELQARSHAVQCRLRGRQ